MRKKRDFNAAWKKDSMVNSQQGFRERMSTLPKISLNNKWDMHRVALRKHAKNEPVAEFIKWSTVRATMFIGSAPYIKSELARLQSSIEWEDRWAEAIKDPGIGSPTMYDEHLASSGNFIHAALYIYTWEIMSGLRFDWTDNDSIFEFGGGYGANCYMMHRLGFSGKYTLFDLPEFLLLQEYYLANTLPSLSIDFESTLPKQVSRHSLFVSNAALSEVGTDLRDRVLDTITAEHYFITFQDIWNDINNIDYFRDFAKYLGHNPDDCIARIQPGGVHWMLAV